MKTRKGIRTDKKQVLKMFREEMGKSFDYINLPELAQKTGIPYVRLWRYLGNGDGDWNADDCLKIVIALNRVDVLKKILVNLERTMHRAQRVG